MSKWQKAHEIVKQIQAMNFSKDSLERCLGIMIHILKDTNGPDDVIGEAGKLILIMRQENGIQDYLNEMKKLDAKLRQSV